VFGSNAQNGAGSGTISAYTDSRNGTLTPVATPPFADQQTAPCWIEITHDGQFLFTVNTGSGSISRFSIAPDGSLTLLGSTSVGQTGGVGAVDARLSPDGRFLYVDESRIGKVGAFAVNGGNLTELGTSPFALPRRCHARGHRDQLVPARQTGAAVRPPRLRSGGLLARLRAASGAMPCARRGPCHPTRRAGRYPSAEATA
jgi:6-phosphogluconolactonase (cycloisomerase 2 family)